ncbi:unnamed protein product [Heterobilharzia americana]|nr:unnamed protein product [Heterobilharzia americana]
MMSGPEACDCDYGFFANHIPGSLNQCKMDYSCNANQHTADEVSNWNIENFKLSSLHYSDNHPEPLLPRYEDEVQFTGFQINSDSLRSASISTEHLHQDLSDAFNSCLNTYCLCSFANVQHQIQDISDCTKCKKFQTYHHDRMRPSPRKLKSINSNAYPFIISNRSAVHNCGLVDHDVYGNPDTSTETKNQLKYMLPYQEELPNISCESGDVAAKEIERIERHYGGRLRTQRAAKIIQNAYRDYRLRVEYSRLRLEKGVNRVAETKNVEVIVQDSDNSKHISTQVTTDNSCMRSGPLDDVNDLVIDRAYIDWSLEASVNQIESHNSTFDSKFSGKVCKTPPASIPPCPPLNSGLLHLNSRHIMPTAPTVMSAPQMESHKVNKNESFQRQYPNHMSCQNQCAHINVPTQCRLHLHPPFLPYGVPSQTIHPSAVTSFPFRNPCVVRLPNAQEKRRKRAYRVGLNIFNKSPMIARFLLTRKGLSRVAIGDYLGNTKNEIAKSTTRQFIRELDFRNQEVDEALRLLLGCFRTPGESQKIVHLLNEFQAAYVEQNSTRVKAQFRSSDTVMILAYAIVMLHTDMYSPNVRPQSKMTQEEFVRNLRGVDSGEDLDRDLLFGIYERIKSKEMSVLSDHTDQVRKIQQHLTGPLKPLNLSVAQRRLVCYCRLYEVPDKNKRERSGAHQRELFLFNDLLLITKAVQKRRKDATIAYQDANINNIVETPNGRARILVTLNTKTSSDRARLMEDLQECILEVTEMERLRMEDVSKQKSTYTQNHCASHKMRTDVIEFTKSGPVMLDKSSLSFDSNTSVTTNINKSVNHKYDHDDGSSGNALQMCAPITCLTNTTELRNTEQTKHIQHHCHRYKSSDGQRLSGDSGLMADLDTPAS